MLNNISYQPHFFHPTKTLNNLIYNYNNGTNFLFVSFITQHFGEMLKKLSNIENKKVIHPDHLKALTKTSRIAQMLNIKQTNNATSIQENAMQSNVFRITLTFN